MKRCYNTAEAMDYLGIKRRAFMLHIAPQAKGVRIGNCVVYERTDLDAAWESYKITAGSERPGEPCKGEHKWDERKRLASRKSVAGMTLIKSTKGSDFADVASSILSQRKSG